ncbi:MAG: EAL domain-containing protein [Pseudomonadota bacterium]
MAKHYSRVLDAIPYVLILFAGVILALILGFFDAFEQLYYLTRAYEAWEADEIVVAAFSTLVALIAVLIVRVRRESQQRRLEQDRLHYLVRRDVVTSLPNQIQLDEELLQRTGLPSNGDEHFALVLVQLSGVERVFDLFGQAAGDHLLKEFGQRLAQLVVSQPGHHLVARMRDGSFALVIAMNKQTHVAEAIVEPIIDMVTRLETNQGFPTALSAHFGVATYPKDGGSPEALLRCAGVALHRAGRTAENSAIYYDAALDEEQRKFVALTADIKNALEARQFEPYFQPLISLKTGHLVGFEALARWVHPDRGVIPPGAFITAAEEMGMIGDLFESVLKKVCIAALGWSPKIKISVNVSPVQLADDRFVDKLLESLRLFDFDPDRLVLEITENAIVRDMSAAGDAMKRLRARGIRFALDDFGTGYSSLTYLSQLPFDSVKIDKSFVADCDKIHSGHAIVESIINLCASLNLKTVGEGVERREEAVALQKLGCDIAQGYWFFKPVPTAVANELVNSWTDQPARGRESGPDGRLIFES